MCKSLLAKKMPLVGLAAEEVETLVPNGVSLIVRSNASMGSSALKLYKQLQYYKQLTSIYVLWL